MPKWIHHRSIAKNLGIQLSKKEMEVIDSILDGIRGGYEHDFWKYDKTSLGKYLRQAYDLYGDHGLKYYLLHIFLDTLQSLIVSEKAKETLTAKAMRKYAHEVAFKYAVGILKLHVKDLLQEREKTVFEQFLGEIESKEEEIAGIVNELPEVRAQVRGIEKFKNKRERAEEIARRFGAQGFLLPLYVSFILELWNDRKRGNLTKEAWANKILEKYRDELKRSYRAPFFDKIYTDLINIAKMLGYVS